MAQLVECLTLLLGLGHDLTALGSALTLDSFCLSPSASSLLALACAVLLSLSLSQINLRKREANVEG